MEQNGKVWNTLEATVSYKVWARLTPTFTHIVTYELVTSGAEDRAMSISEKKSIIWRGGVRESNSMQMSYCEE